jgi:hypothetical protein
MAATEQFDYSALAVSLYYSVAKDKLDWDNIVPTCLDLGAALEDVRNVNGAYRLQVLQEVLLIALNRGNVVDDRKRKLFQLIYETVPILMRGVIAASKSPIVHAAAEEVDNYCCGRRKRN